MFTLDEHHNHWPNARYTNHMLCDSDDRLCVLRLTTGQVHDIQGGRALLAGVPSVRRLIADTAKVYDGNDVRDFLASQGTEPVFSPTPRRMVRPAFDTKTYRART